MNLMDEVQMNGEAAVIETLTNAVEGLELLSNMSLYIKYRANEPNDISYRDSFRALLEAHVLMMQNILETYDALLKHAQNLQ